MLFLAVSHYMTLLCIQGLSFDALATWKDQAFYAKHSSDVHVKLLPPPQTLILNPH